MMRSHRGFGLILAATLAISMLACSSDLNGAGGGGAGGDGSAAGGSGGKAYTLTFACDPNAGPECPAGQPCPEVPLSSTTCGDVPAQLGQPSIPAPAARPVGCDAFLPYGNPYYQDMQVQCRCVAAATISGAGWQCAL